MLAVQQIIVNNVDNPIGRFRHRGGTVKTIHARMRIGPAACSLAVLILAACGGGSGNTGAGLGSGDLLVGVLAPFSGVDANLGPAYYAACLAAAPSINNNGGVGGRNVKCQQFDTRGEPADAAPAANQMVASNSNLMAVVGCTSDEASAVAPIVNGAHIPMFCMTGQSEFNKTKLPYFHRLVPADIYAAYAMVGWALYGPSPAPFHKAALVFGDDIGSQAFVDPATNAFTKFGGQVKNFPIKLGASSYRTEVTQVIQYQPDVIFTEAIGSAGTFLGEFKTLNGGKMIPIIGTSATIDPEWFAAVKGASGADDIVKYYGGVDLGYTFSGPAYTEFLTNLNAAASTFPQAPNTSSEDRRCTCTTASSCRRSPWWRRTARTRRSTTRRSRRSPTGRRARPRSIPTRKAWTRSRPASPSASSAPVGRTPLTSTTTQCRATSW